MISLGTIVPEGFGVVDLDCIGRQLSIPLFDRHVSGEEAGDGLVHVVDRYTRLIKRRLHHRMILSNISHVAAGVE